MGSRINRKRESSGQNGTPKHNTKERTHDRQLKESGFPPSAGVSLLIGAILGHAAEPQLMTRQLQLELASALGSPRSFPAKSRAPAVSEQREKPVQDT